MRGARGRIVNLMARLLMSRRRGKGTPDALLSMLPDSALVPLDPPESAVATGPQAPTGNPALDAAYNALRTRLSEAEQSLRELSSAARAEAELRAQLVDAHAASSAASRARIAELEAALGAALAAAKEARPELVGLRRIRGIGPAYERSLLALGITTIAQIAALGPEELARVATQIKARPDRALRDDWVGQAQRLLADQADK